MKFHHRPKRSLYSNSNGKKGHKENEVLRDRPIIQSGADIIKQAIALTQFYINLSPQQPRSPLLNVEQDKNLHVLEISFLGL